MSGFAGIWPPATSSVDRVDYKAAAQSWLRTSQLKFLTATADLPIKLINLSVSLWVFPRPLSPARRQTDRGTAWRPVSGGIDHRPRQVEDAVLFPSQSVSGREAGIERFNSPKIEWGAEVGGGWGGLVGRKKGNVGDKDGVCVFVCRREKKGKTGRDSDKLTWGKWDVTSREKEMLNQCCQGFSQSETDAGDCRQYYWRWAASLMTARRPCFQQCWL